MKSYQLIHHLDPHQFARLKADIERVGVQVPIVLDEDGNLIDGRARRQAARELGIHCPAEVRQFRSEQEKWETALRLNALRRHLRPRERRELIGAYLSKDASISDNWLAQIVGCSSNTVNDVRRKLVEEKKIEDLPMLRSADGKMRPQRNKIIVASTAKQVASALADIKDLDNSVRGRVDASTARRLARRNRMARSYRLARDKRLRVPSSDDQVAMYHCDFRDLQKLAGFETGSIKYVCTDILFAREWLPNVQDLSAACAEWLADDGVFSTYSGIQFLPQVLDGLRTHLHYRWTISRVYPKVQLKPLRGRVQANIEKWRAIPVFTKAENPAKWHQGFCDVIEITGDKEKEWHPYQQSWRELVKLIEAFSEPGDLICDPCAGSFSTAIACLESGRRFVGCDIDSQNVLNGQERVAEWVERKASYGLMSVSPPAIVESAR